MMATETQQLYERIASLLERGETEGLRPTLADAHAADIAEVFGLLDDGERSTLIFAMEPRLTAEVIVLLDEADRGDVVEELDNAALTQIVTELPPDDAADVLGELSEDQREGILEQVPDAQSDQLEDLLEYPEDTAGGIMTPDLIAMPRTATVRETIEAVRQASPEEIHHLYVVDDDGRLFGLVPLRKLVTNPPERRLADICERDAITVRVTDDQEQVVRIFRKYDVSAVPVVDENGKLLGCITHDDVMDVAEEEADEDIYRMAGTDPTELETSSVVRAARIRFQWLVPAFFMETISAAAIVTLGHHLPHLAAGAILAFIPMIAAMSGNCGVQISTVIVRGIASGDLADTQLSLAFLREGRIALLMLPMCGLFSFVIAGFGLPLLERMGEVQPPGVSSLTVACAVGFGLALAILVAAILGICLPFFFRRVGVDPAIAAGPIVTTCNDVISISTYLAISMALIT